MSINNKKLIFKKKKRSINTFIMVFILILIIAYLYKFTNVLT